MTAVATLQGSEQQLTPPLFVRLVNVPEAVLIGLRSRINAIALARPAAVVDLIRHAATAVRPNAAHSTEEDPMSATS